MEILFVFLLGVVSSFLSNMTGGGGYFILLPTLIHLGVSPLQAIGTLKFSALGIVAGSLFGARNKNVINKEHLKPLMILAIITALIGPRFAFLFNDEQVKIISSVLIVITAIISVFGLRAKSKNNISKNQRYLGYAAFFGVNLVFSAFGSGLGMIVNYIMIGMLGLGAVEAIATRRLVSVVILPITAFIFASQGAVNYRLGIALLLGTAVGGFFGLNFAIKKGDMFVKRAMAVLAIVLAASLFV